jgi:hypothetical protein
MRDGRWSALARARIAALAALGVALGVALLATEARAQLATGLQLSTGAVGSDGDGQWRGSSELAAWLRYDRPWLTATLEGAAAGEERARWAYGGLLTTTLFAPSWNGLRPSVSLAAAQQDAPLGGSVLESQGVIRLGFHRAASGGWVGGGWGTARLTGAARNAEASPASPLLPAGWSTEVGGWHQFGDAVVRLSVASRARSLDALPGSPRAVAIGPLRYDPSSRTYVADTMRVTSDRWSEAEAGVYWAHGRWSLDAAIGRPLSGVATGSIWTRLDATLALNDRVALLVGGGAAPAELSLVAPDRRRLTVGFRWTRAPLPHAATPAIEPVAAAFRVERADARRARIFVRVPAARTVELGADFTRWQPVALERTAPDEWSITLPISPGTYHVNLRVNGGNWIAPPGLPRVRDDFAGVVGLVVVH